MDHFYLFVVASLGVWRLTHLVSSEDGPWRCFARLRNALAGRMWAELVTCFYCFSVWASLPLAIAIGLTAIGSVTRKRYIFTAPGVRVAVDRRDFESLLHIPMLRYVR